MAARGGAQRPNGATQGKICQFKLVLLGESAVGKSSLVLRFVKGQFHEYQESTIGGKSTLSYYCYSVSVFLKSIFKRNQNKKYPANSQVITCARSSQILRVKYMYLHHVSCSPFEWDIDVASYILLCKTSHKMRLDFVKNTTILLLPRCSILGQNCMCNLTLFCRFSCIFNSDRVPRRHNSKV